MGLTLLAGLDPGATQGWTANAHLSEASSRTLAGVGAAQGISFHDGYAYVYGDRDDLEPRVGVIREFDLDFVPTGRVVWLRGDGGPLLTHPTGLTWHPRWGSFIGDTVRGRAVIFRLDWARALADGDLARAVLGRIDDDVARNGCRPRFVRLWGRDYLATADYGDNLPEVRLLDPERLAHAARTSEDGVVAFRFSAGPFNQNLSFDPETGELTCVQNVVAGRGWQLDVLDLARAVEARDGNAEGARRARFTLEPRSELEGYEPRGDGGVFVTSEPENNLVTARFRPTPAGKSEMPGP